MARPTLGSIITRAHRLASIPEQSSGRSDAPALPAEMIDEANAALGELHDIIVEAWEDYFTVSTQLQMVASQKTTRLPIDFYKLMSLAIYIDTDQRVIAKQWQMQDLNRYQIQEAWDYPDYRIIGQNIEWLPLPGTTRTVEMYYIRQFKALEESTDEISPEIPRGWEDFVVACLALYLLDKTEIDPTRMLMRKEEARQRIMTSAAQRNSFESKRSVDAYNRYSGYRRRDRFPYPRV